MFKKSIKNIINKRLTTFIIILILSTIVLIPTNFGSNIQDKKIINNSNYEEKQLSVMRPNINILNKWEKEYQNSEEVYINPNLKEKITNTDDFSLLDHLNYIPEERDQGWCSNCWAWPSTAILEIALYVQKNIFTRLSVQFINSCGEETGIQCCEGGNLNDFSRFYRSKDIAIPWSNTNAYWQDIRAQCRTPCNSISTVPNYPITKILQRTIATHRINSSDAINNIKNVLHQERGIYFTIIFPTESVLSNFQNFWRNDREDKIYDLDYANGIDLNEEDAAGHAVLIVGYYDDPDKNNSDYWIMLNSWGTTNRRPNGLFLVDMHMDYDCNYKLDDNEYYAFNSQTLEVEFKSNLESPYLPELEGETNGLIDTIYRYNVSAIDPQNDDVFYYIDWGDETNTSWLGPYSSGEKIQLEKSWDTKGDFLISAKAKDTNDAESDWVTLEINMPKNIFSKTSNFKILYKILINFSNFFQ